MTIPLLASENFSQNFFVADMERENVPPVLFSREQIETIPKEALPHYLTKNSDDIATTSELFMQPSSVLLNKPRNESEINIMAIPQARTKLNRFVALKKWEGIVLERSSDYFTARLIDLDRIEPDEEAEIYYDEVSSDDMPLLKNGAYFYWNIGYHIDKSGQRRRVSTIRFKRLFTWSAEAIHAATKSAMETAEMIGWK